MNRRALSRNDDTILWWQLFTATTRHSEEVNGAMECLLSEIAELDPVILAHLRGPLECLRERLSAAHQALANGSCLPSPQIYRPALATAQRADTSRALDTLDTIDWSSVLTGAEPEETGAPASGFVVAQVDGQLDARRTFTDEEPPPEVRMVRLAVHITNNGQDQAVSKVLYRRGVGDTEGLWVTDETELTWAAVAAQAKALGTVAFDATPEVCDPNRMPWTVAGFKLGDPGVFRDAHGRIGRTFLAPPAGGKRVVMEEFLRTMAPSGDTPVRIVKDEAAELAERLKQPSSQVEAFTESLRPFLAELVKQIRGRR